MVRSRFQVRQTVLHEQLSLRFDAPYLTRARQQLNFILQTTHTLMAKKAAKKPTERKATSEFTTPPSTPTETPVKRRTRTKKVETEPSIIFEVGGIKHTDLDAAEQHLTKLRKLKRGQQIANDLSGLLGKKAKASSKIVHALVEAIILAGPSALLPLVELLTEEGAPAGMLVGVQQMQSVGVTEVAARTVAVHQQHAEDQPTPPAVFVGGAGFAPPPGFGGPPADQSDGNDDA